MSMPGIATRYVTLEFKRMLASEPYVDGAPPGHANPPPKYTGGNPFYDRETGLPIPGSPADKQNNP